MKSLLSLPILLLLPIGEASAADGQFGASVSGGVAFLDPLEVLDTGPVIVPRLNYWANPTLAIELEIGAGLGQTSFGIPETFSYTSLTPRLGFTGRVFEEEPLNLLLNLSAGAWMKSIGDDGALGLPQGTGMDVDFLGAAGPGLMLPMGDSGLALRTDLRFLLSLGSQSEVYQNRGEAFLSWEWTAGIAFGVPVKKDQDKDGIVDSADTCQTEAEDVDQFEDTDGCPELDNDKDGIVDADDQCDADAEDMDKFDDADGCSDPDNDKDGLADGDDQCPVEPGPEGAKGCPDADNDGIVDTVDECETEAGTKNSFGCPDQDADRVPDYRDECPDVNAGEKINPLRSNGCATRVYFSDQQLVITETIQFDTGKATIKKASDPLLADIANLLTKYPGVKKLQIEGHTDDKGDDAANLKLSEERAASVQKWLVEKGGIDAARLVAKGLGETEPVADNTTDAGRTQNRRVEFEILDQDMGAGLKRKLEKQAEGGGDAPKADAPKADAPKAEEKKVEEPKPAEAPKAEEKKAEETKPAEAPKAEEKAVDAPKAEEPKAEEPKAEEKK